MRRAPPAPLRLARVVQVGQRNPSKPEIVRRIDASLATVLEGVGASAYAPYSAPEGYRWDFVYDDGELVTDQGEPVVDLVEIT